ncbi:putative glutathione peroxidase [Sterolibacterium denitrificans]|uniref:Glutathione peroxidase n=1 Tax=Sterolibacterium denitrificans TaxID=157592 RepID=A0A7Z7MV67_9PROT|nr:glutathione peroxidase [Sterolibacterium denitrificans]SMB26141.1 putative glutathione peroxidase [Sterolibacterium denitrificans]
MEKFHDISVKAIDGRDVNLADYAGKVVLVVNTASKCGFTPQYDGLEALYEKYRERGFVVLGFPCNQFGAQEPGSEQQIAEFCETRFNIAFPMFAKIDVNGPNAHPLYRHLKAARPGVFNTEGIKWNFTKFLIDRNGNVVERYAPATKPEDLAAAIEALL